MERIEVKSSTIRVIGYDAKEQILEVTFTSAATYRYSGVSKEVADAFLQAESKGIFFSTTIRPCYQFERVHADGCAPRLQCTVVNCECWCHKQKREASNAPNPNLEKELKKSIKQAREAKAKTRTPI